jgi:hypothetical protein
MKRAKVVALSFLLLGGLLACSGVELSGPGSGTLSVYLTDAPIDLDDVTAVNVAVASMSVLPVCDDPEEECSELLLDLIPPEGSDGVVVNLLDYRDGEVILMASEGVPEGAYQKIRMEIAAASLHRDDDLDPETPDAVEDIFVPSGKVDVVVPFLISAGEQTEIVLDFDAALSVHLNETGNHRYILRPVINGSRR